MTGPAGKHLAAVLTVALTLRLGAVWYWQSQLGDRDFGFPDSESYWALGQAIAAGEPYQCGDEAYRVFRTPGYPLLLAPIHAMAAGRTALMLARAQAALLGTLAVAGVWWLTRLWFDRRAALGAAILAAVYPEAVVGSVLVLSEAPFCPLMLLHLGLWTLACRAGSPRRGLTWALLAGAVAGLATLMRPGWMLFVPVAMIAGALVPRPSSPEPATAGRKRVLWTGAASLTALAAVMAPWWIRNAAATGRFVPTTLQFGATLYDGLSPAATGASDMRFVADFTEALRADEQAGRADPRDFEFNLDRRHCDAAVAWAKAHPADALRLTAVKLGRTWNLWPNEGRMSSWPIRLAVALSYLPVMLLAAVGVVRTFRRGWPYWLGWLPAVYLSLLHAVFVGSIRYRLPAMLTLTALAGGALALAWKGKMQNEKCKSQNEDLAAQTEN
jgi:4-amino-4-deoxy-L-arabinose transferase-like glycosyltransferase